MTIKSPIIFALTATILAMTGCVSERIKSDVETAVRTKDTDARDYFQRANPTRTKAEREALQEVNMPFVAGKSIPLARNVSLPRPLQAGVNTAVLFPKNAISLAAAAERIMLASGLYVSIAQDVYIEDSMLMPKSFQSSKSAVPQALPLGVSPVTSSSGLPDLSGLQNSIEQKTEHSLTGNRTPDTPYNLEFPRVEAPLAQILDLIAVRLGIRWKFEESTNTIRFYRLVTKTWSTPFSSANSRYSTDFEGITSASNNQNAIAVRPGISPVGSASKDVNELKSISDNVSSIMTKSGSIVTNASTGTITLTDTYDVVESADRMIANEVSILSRVVLLKVQTIQVTNNDIEQAGVDIGGVVNAVLQKMPNLNFSAGSPASLVSANSGSFGINVLSGQANGTTAIIDALKQYGKVQTSIEMPLITRNHRAIYYNVTNTFSYVSSTTPGTASITGGGGTPGITTSQDQVGLKLMMYPNVTSRDTVMLTMSLDQSVLQGIQSFASGSGSNQQTVQLPNKNGEGSNQEVPIKSGQTIVITGFDKTSDQYDKRTLADGVPILFGGSGKANRERTTTLVLVSVLVKDIDN